MTPELSVLIFRYSWSFLLIITILYLILFEDWPKTKAAAITNFIVVVPYLMVFGLYYLRDSIGAYEGSGTSRIAGAALLFLGVSVYLLSHVSLRGNWSVMASIKEKHTLVTTGLYRYVRHPMYASMLLIVPGSGMLIADYLMILCMPIVGLIYYFRAREEEALLAGNLPGYDRYLRKTKMFIPWIF
jgi:protein-S-isoprenylcysteine O-methyltransferase Ste14